MNRNSKPLVSVCLPTFNGERHLSCAIESVLAQTFTNFELLISDDRSSDASPSIAEDFARRDERIRLVNREANLGLFGNYNACMNEARGVYIKPFAQDDILEPDFLAKTICVLEDYPDVTLVSTNRHHMDSSGRRIEVALPPRPTWIGAGKPVQGLQLLKDSLFPVNNFVGEPVCVIFRRENVGEGFDCTFAHIGDLDFWLRLALNGKYFHLDEELCGFRQHESSNTSYNRRHLLYAPDIFALGDKYVGTFELMGHSMKDFIEFALDTISQQMRLDNAIEGLTSLTEESKIHDPFGFRRVAAYALDALAETKNYNDSNLKKQLRIQTLERELRSYLNSPSWRLTKPLRDINLSGTSAPLPCRVEILTEGNNQVTDNKGSAFSECAPIDSSEPVESYVEPDGYKLYLEQMISQIHHSRSWQVTAPIRWFEGRISRFSNAALSGKASMSKFSERMRNYLRRTSRSSSKTAQASLVSIIIATYNRAKFLRRALASVQAQTFKNWECIIVDDGSEDDTAAIMQEFLSDSRFKYIRREHRGVSAARNSGLKAATGEIIAYLDSDNVWLGEYLERVAKAYEQSPETQSIYTAQVFQEHNGEDIFRMRYEPWDQAQLLVDNYIDLNVFSHRRALVDSCGWFDESLESLVDWDLILRYTRDQPVLSLPCIGSFYLTDAKQRITNTANHAKSRLIISQSFSAGVANGTMRVLYALWQYPQLTQSYIETEIRAVRKLGVHVEVWAEEDVAVPHQTDVRIHRGKLQDAINNVRPQIIHTHWLHIALNYEPMLRSAQLPCTVRAHGFEVTPELLADLEHSKTIRKIFIHPHQMWQLPRHSEKLVPLVAAFNESLYSPSFQKNRKLVLRVGAGLWHKGYRQFFETALMCPDHEFLTVIGTVYQREFVMDEIFEANAKLGNPVRILRDLQPEEIKDIVNRAGIYMYTLGLEEPFGMPISVAESMSTGAVILACDRSEARSYIGDAGLFYSDTEHAARLIKDSANWMEADWQQGFCRSVDRAHRNFRSLDVYSKLVDCWREILNMPVSDVPSFDLARSNTIAPSMNANESGNRKTGIRTADHEGALMV